MTTDSVNFSNSWNFSTNFDQRVSIQVNKQTQSKYYVCKSNIRTSTNSQIRNRNNCEFRHQNIFQQNPSNVMVYVMKTGFEWWVHCKTIFLANNTIECSGFYLRTWTFGIQIKEKNQNTDKRTMQTSNAVWWVRNIAKNACAAPKR